MQIFKLRYKSTGNNLVIEKYFTTEPRAWQWALKCGVAKICVIDRITVDTTEVE